MALAFYVIHTFVPSAVITPSTILAWTNIAQMSAIESKPPDVIWPAGKWPMADTVLIFILGAFTGEGQTAMNIHATNVFVIVVFAKVRVSLWHPNVTAEVP